MGTGLKGLRPGGTMSSVNARPTLERIAEALAAVRLDAVLVGNAAAALHGAPVTTLDFDFMFRDTPLNRTKLKRFAKAIGAVVFRPYYPVSKLYRVVDDDAGLQINFMPALHGVRSFRGTPRRLGRRAREPAMARNAGHMDDGERRC
ncbi:MAG: hypothetical protein AMXMBFR56_14570 [Polyangiaceae bacterium]